MCGWFALGYCPQLFLCDNGKKAKEEGIAAIWGETRLPFQNGQKSTRGGAIFLGGGAPPLKSVQNLSKGGGQTPKKTPRGGAQNQGGGK